MNHTTANDGRVQENWHTNQKVFKFTTITNDLRMGVESINVMMPRFISTCTGCNGPSLDTYLSWEDFAQEERERECQGKFTLYTDGSLKQMKLTRGTEVATGAAVFSVTE